jgi:enoyl-CoA hydratase/carnithine racemase
MMLALKEQAEKLDGNRDIRAVIIHSSCPRAFGVGADINDWGALEPIEMWRSWTRHGHRIIRLIEELVQPVIAVINGFAYGGSLELALAADIRIGEGGSRYGFPEARIGTIPGWLGTQKALQLIGPSTLKKMIFTGQPITDAEAFRSGLIDELAEPGEGLAKARNMAARIAENSPVSVSLAKQIVNSLASGQAATALESFAGGLAAQSADGREGIESFRQKRPARFSGY